MAYSDSEVEQGLVSNRAVEATQKHSASEGEGFEMRRSEVSFGRLLKTVAPVALVGAAVFSVGAYGVSKLLQEGASGRPESRWSTKAGSALFSEPPAPIVATPASAVATAPAGAVNTRRVPSVKPAENMHDGNFCDDTEELYAGLCYTKCSILTGIPTARRSTAFSCCPTSDCHGNVFKMKTVSLLPCHGYDVSSADEGKACPHEEGACLADEEQFTGECYEKCELLTNGRFPKRIAAASCCNPDAVGGCLNLMNDRTMGKLMVGGGKGDADASTPSTPHFPLKSVTEE